MVASILELTIIFSKSDGFVFKSSFRRVQTEIFAGHIHTFVFIVLVTSFGDIHLTVSLSRTPL